MTQAEILTYLSLLSTIFAAVATVLLWRVGAQQKEIQRCQYRLQYFDKRFALYQEVAECLDLIAKHGGVLAKDGLMHKRLNSLQAKADYFFDQEIVDFLSEMFTQFCLLDPMLDVIAEGDDEIRQQSKWKALNWVGHHVEILDSIFFPHLRIETSDALVPSHRLRKGMELIAKRMGVQPERP